jgi:plastocyanin
MTISFAKILSRSAVMALLFGPVAGAVLAQRGLRAEDAKSADIKPANAVSIDNFTFSPAVLTVAKGTTVTWVNHDDIPHTVVNKDKAFRSKALDTDDSFSYTFTTSGTFDYFCGLHPHMVGKVVVTE